MTTMHEKLVAEVHYHNERLSELNIKMKVALESTYYKPLHCIAADIKATSKNLDEAARNLAVFQDNNLSD
jgi:hypothetical protein